MRHELLVRPRRGDATVLQEEDAVGESDGGNAVGDDQGGGREVRAETVEDLATKKPSPANLGVLKKLAEALPDKAPRDLKFRVK